MTAQPANRLLITLRQPAANKAELVITTDGEAAVHHLSLDQLKLLAPQIVKALVGWPEVRS
jgi:hypothetical protein